MNRIEYLDTIKVKTDKYWKTINRYRHYFSGKMEIIEETISIILDY